MQVINQVLADELKALLRLQEEIAAMEKKIISLQKTNASIESQETIQFKIKMLRENLRLKEQEALDLFN